MTIKLKKGYSQLTYLTLTTKKIMWRKSWSVRLLCHLTRHLTGYSTIMCQTNDIFSRIVSWQLQLKQVGKKIRLTISFRSVTSQQERLIAISECHGYWDRRSSSSSSIIYSKQMCLKNNRVKEYYGEIRSPYFSHSDSYIALWNEHRGTSERKGRQNNYRFC